MIATLPPQPDMVSVAYVKDDTYTFTITNEQNHAEFDPGINLYQGQRFAWADKNVLVRPGHKVTVTIKFPTDGKWAIGTVDSIAYQNGYPNPDTEYSDPAVRWNHLHSLYVR